MNPKLGEATIVIAARSEIYASSRGGGASGGARARASGVCAGAVCTRVTGDTNYNEVLRGIRLKIVGRSRVLSAGSVRARARRPRARARGGLVRRAARRVLRSERERRSGMWRVVLIVFLRGATIGLITTSAVVSSFEDGSPGQQRSNGLSEHPPVIVHVLVDDLGFADLGYLDGKLSTPHIDALRSSGIELSSYYAWKYCNPSRAMLLTGRYMHNVGIYSNGGAPSLDFTLLPDRLKQASPSLRAVMIGKWYNLRLSSCRSSIAHELETARVTGTLGNHTDAIRRPIGDLTRGWVTMMETRSAEQLHV
eukprot:COSAG02_NODE_624_length_19387_cov_90.736002_10_plen_309_part_00